MDSTHTRASTLRRFSCLIALLLAFPETISGFLRPNPLPTPVTTLRSSAIKPQTGIYQSHLAASTQQDEQEPTTSTTKSKSKWVSRTLNRIGLRRTIQESKDGQALAAASEKSTQSSKDEKVVYNITTLDQLDDYWQDKEKRFRTESGDINYNQLVTSANVQGDTQIIGSPNHPDYMHPVAQLVHERRRLNSLSSNRTDNCKIALAIEGGGMRGCVTGGMVCALEHLGLRDSFDVVYGSSAGSMIGAYFINGQLPWFGPEVYYDKLTTAGNEFIDTKRLLRSLGVGLVDPRLLKDVVTRRSNGKPVLNLQFLLGTTMQETKPLDWELFLKRQKELPLKVVASGLKSQKSVILDNENGAWNNLQELAWSMHASCLLPGIAGPAMNINRKEQAKNVVSSSKFVLGNNIKSADYEPMADALIYEPLPFHTAIKDGATHVVVLRSRPDGTDSTGKSSIFERLIMKRFFMRKNRLVHIYQRMRMHLHKKAYAESIIILNEQAMSDRHYKNTDEPHLLAVALPPGSPEVGRLETGRQAIFEGVRRGFARTYDALVEDPAERGRGAIVAKEFFPDEIMDYDPRDIDTTEESAYAYYLKNKGASIAK